MPHEITREEAEKIYPRSIFPNEIAWKITVERIIGHKTCVQCEHFMDIKFDVDNCLSFDGVCRKLKKAIPYKYYSPC